MLHPEGIISLSHMLATELDKRKTLLPLDNLHGREHLVTLCEQQRKQWFGQRIAIRCVVPMSPPDHYIIT